MERNAHYAHLNTETGPGHASLGTGAPPRVTGIVANRWFEPRRRRVSPPGLLHRPAVRGSRRRRTTAFRPGPGNLRVPTLGDRLLERYPEARVVSLSGKDRGAIFMAGKTARARRLLVGPGRRAASSRRPRTTPRRPAAPSCRRSSPGSTGPVPGGHLPRRLGLAWRKMADPSLPGRDVRRPRSRPVPAFEMRPFQIPVNGLGWDKDMSLASNGYFHGIYYSPFIDELTMDLALEVAGLEGPRAGPRGAAGHPLPRRCPARTRSPTPTARSPRRTSTPSGASTSSSAASSRRSTAASRRGRSSSRSRPTTASRRSPSSRRGRDKSFKGGRVLSGNGAVNNFEERLNRYLCEELCLPLDATADLRERGIRPEVQPPRPSPRCAPSPGPAAPRRTRRHGGRHRPRPPGRRWRGFTTRSSERSSSPRSGRAGTRPTATSVSR